MVSPNEVANNDIFYWATQEKTLQTNTEMLVLFTCLHVASSNLWVGLGE